MFTRRCPGCGTVRAALCGECLAHLASPVPFRLGQRSGSALRQYDSFAQQVILAGKNGGRPDVLRRLGQMLGRLGYELVPDHHEPLTVCWIPASRAGRRGRGFDQGRILARSAAVEVSHLRAGEGAAAVRSRQLLTRRDNRSQTGLPRCDRLVGPDLCWAGGRPPGHVLLIDDVVTTGSSLHAATRLLEASGATRVDVVAAAVVT